MSLKVYTTSLFMLSAFHCTQHIDPNDESYAIYDDISESESGDEEEEQ